MPSYEFLEEMKTTTVGAYIVGVTSIIASTMFLGTQYSVAFVPLVANIAILYIMFATDFPFRKEIEGGDTDSEGEEEVDDSESVVSGASAKTPPLPDSDNERDDDEKHTPYKSPPLPPMIPPKLAQLLKPEPELLFSPPVQEQRLIDLEAVD